MAVYGGVRGLAQAFIRKGVKMGLSRGAIFDSLKPGKLTFRRQDFLADYREWAQVPKKAGVIRYTRRDLYPGKDLFVTTTGKQRLPFRYQVAGTIYNPETHERLPFTTNVVSDTQMTPDQVYEEALEPIKQSTSAYKSDIQDYHLEGAFVKEGTEWL